MQKLSSSLLLPKVCLLFEVAVKPVCKFEGETWIEFGCSRGWGKLFNRELGDLFVAPCAVMVIRSKVIRLVEY